MENSLTMMLRTSSTRAALPCGPPCAPSNKYPSLLFVFILTFWVFLYLTLSKLPYLLSCTLLESSLALAVITTELPFTFRAFDHH